MAESSKANTVPEGTTFVFGSWACTADESGGFIGHLISPKGPKAKLNDQPAGTADAPKLSGNRALPELDSENLRNMSTPTRTTGEVSPTPTQIPKKSNFLKLWKSTWLMSSQSNALRSTAQNYLMEWIEFSNRSKDVSSSQNPLSVHLRHSRTRKIRTHITPKCVKCSPRSIELIPRSSTAST